VAFGCNTHLAKPAAAGNAYAHVRTFGQFALKFRILIIIHQRRDLARKDGSFKYNHG